MWTLAVPEGGNIKEPKHNSQNLHSLSENNQWIKGHILAQIEIPFNLWDLTKAQSIFH